MAEEWITTNEAADLAGYHPDHIRRLILAGKIEARRFGPVWAVHRQSLLDYLRKMEELGERRGPKPEGGEPGGK